MTLLMGMVTDTEGELAAELLVDCKWEEVVRRIHLTTRQEVDTFQGFVSHEHAAMTLEFLWDRLEKVSQLGTTRAHRTISPRQVGAHSPLPPFRQCGLEQACCNLKGSAQILSR